MSIYFFNIWTRALCTASPCFLHPARDSKYHSSHIVLIYIKVIRSLSISPMHPLTLVKSPCKFTRTGMHQTSEHQSCWYIRIAGCGLCSRNAFHVWVMGRLYEKRGWACIFRLANIPKHFHQCFKHHREFHAPSETICNLQRFIAPDPD